MIIKIILFILYLITIVVSFDQIRIVEEWIPKQKKISYNLILNNLNPKGSKRGFFPASLSTFQPDYFYTWTRDAALVSRVLSNLKETNSKDLIDYIDFQIDTQTTFNLCNCLGEPKFNINGTAYMGSWGRPQNDGPAERIISFILIYNRLQLNNQTILNSIQLDLEYILNVWNQPCFDLWEELNGIHFYTLMVIRRAILDSIDLFISLSFGLDRLEYYQSTVENIQLFISTFWSIDLQQVISSQQIKNGLSRPSNLDVSILLASNLLANRHDDFFTPGSDKIIATAFKLHQIFQSLYPINQSGQVAIGRYPEDRYDGYGISVGNPWFIATAAYAELYFLAARDWRERGLVVTWINLPFLRWLLGRDLVRGYLKSTHPILLEIVRKTEILADRYLNTIQLHQHRNGSMSEQFDRYIGFMTGARDLSWSHAAVLTAFMAKENILDI